MYNYLACVYVEIGAVLFLLYYFGGLLKNTQILDGFLASFSTCHANHEKERKNDQ
jgi:hypothetical protein